MKKSIWLVFLLSLYSFARLQAQTTVSFNFSLTSKTMSGWVNISGDPSIALRSGVSNGITVSSGSATNWVAIPGTGSAFDAVGAGGGFFPTAVMANHWFQYGTLASYNAAVPQLQISGLNKDSVYTIKMTGSSTSSYTTNPTQYTVAGKTVDGYIDINTHGNTTAGATFNNIAPDTSGVIRVFINTVLTTDVADICGIQIIRGHTNPPPIITITNPDNNDVLSEEGNVTINAMATESGGSIVKVQFFVGDTTKIGEATAPPYAATWVSPDEGHYKITATAVDALGNSNSTSINVSVESLGGFWSTTGNIAVNSDSFFLGTVDTSRFVIRTKNIPRLTIDSGGNVNMLLNHPSTFTIKKSTDTSAAHPAFKVYDNGDLAAGTTMDRHVYTGDQTGFRYYAKQGILQIGASDRLDTTQNPIVYGIWPSSALIINSDSANIIKGKLMNTVFAGDLNIMDSATWMENCFIGSESSHFTSSMGTMVRTVLNGFSISISATVDACLINGLNHTISKPMTGVSMNGYLHQTMDTAYNSLIAGGGNQFGGVSQFVAGRYLVNRTPAGTTLGNANVDFASLNFTGLKVMNAPGIAGYPLFALGNGSANDGSIRSNAITVLFNGRTQINSTGFTNNLTQADATPKAALEVVSTNSGVLLPKLTNAQRNAIASGDLQNGLLLYNTDSSAFQFYNGSAWTSVGSGGAGAGHWQFSSGVQFDTTNNIAIGTSNPQGYKLAVNGTAIFTKVRVKTAGTWPDYVFKKGYVLPDLNELEQYISLHKHLPGIVSELEANQDGVDVGDHQEAMLKKVEELTLYLIEENKRLKEQSKQAERQRTEIEQQNKLIEHQNARLENQQQQIDELKELIRNRK
jgi:hypothetical protein